MNKTISGTLRAVILAGGRSKRFKSPLNKLLHHLCGKPVIQYVIEACQSAGIENIHLITGHDTDDFKNLFGDQCRYVLQNEPLGTAHAVLQVRPYLENYAGDLVVLAGDCPFIDGQTLLDLVTHHRQTNADATLITAVFPDTPPFGRIIRDERGRFQKIVEAKDASPEELAIKEVNVTLYCFKTPIVMPFLSEVKNTNVQGEYYITDVFRILLDKGYRVETMRSGNPYIGYGINTPDEFEKSRKIIQNNYIESLKNSEVTFPDPDRVTIDVMVTIGRGTIIHPLSVITGNTVIGEYCEIGPRTMIHDSQIGNHCKITGGDIKNSDLPDDSIITSIFS